MRVLAVSDDTSMQVVLSLRTSSDFDIVTVGDLDELDPEDRTDFDAVLVAVRDIGGAMSAIVDARERVGDVPAILVSAAPPADLDDSITPVRTASDLQGLEAVISSAVDRWADRGTGSHASRRSRAGGRRRSRRSERRGRSRWSFTSRRPAQRRDPRPAAEQEPGEASRVDEPAARGPSPGVTDRRRAALPSRPDLLAGLRGASRLQQLADEVPQLTSRPAVGHLVVDRVWDTFDPDAAVLWGLNGAGALEAISWRGVSPSVLRHEPSIEQPLVADLLETTDALTYTAEERFPAYLDGLPGLRGDAVIGAALRAADEVHGIVVAAGTGYHQVHASELRDLVDDHALLLAIAAHLELLRRRSRVDLTTTDHESLFA